MKKTLIALAVAGVVAAPAAFAATSNVDVYGTIRMSLDSVDSDTAANEKWNVVDRVSRIGFKGSEDLGGGLKAIWQIEQQLNSTAAPLTGTDSAFGNSATRNTFVGLAGGFGTVLIGRHDAPYKMGGSADLFGDTAGDAQGGSGIIGSGNFDMRVSGTVAYVSPTFSGFHFAAATVPGEVGNSANDGVMDAYSLVGVYANGPLKATLSYQDHKDLVLDETGLKANVAFNLGDVMLGATYEKQDNVSGTANRDKKAWMASAAYNMGNITLKAQYGDRNDDLNSNDLTRWTMGADYNFSKRTVVYALYNSDDANNVDEKTFSMGINHSF